MITTVSMLPGEHWWGGTTMHNYCPLTESSDYEQDFRNFAPNQTMPLFVSDKGRYLWSDAPFRVTVNRGIFTFEGEAVTLFAGGTTLREAYLAAQKAHFPCDKKPLESRFFTGVQYNSWMEFTYYPTQEGILRYARRLLAEGYAPGIFIMDEGWHQSTAYGNWEFDFARFPNPKGMVEELHRLGFTVMLWVVPFVAPVGPAYVRSLHPFIGTDPQSAKCIYKRTAAGEVAMVKWWNGISAILDMTNPYNRDFLAAQLHRLQREYGIDGFKFDGGAVHHYTQENLVNGIYPPENDPVACNKAWNAFGAEYPFHEYKDTYLGGGKNTVQRLHDRDHRWVGNGIDDIIPCALTAGLTGHPFLCPDMVGGGEWRNRYTVGFSVDEELFVRMAQCAALFPMMQFSWAPWEALSPQNQVLCRNAATLHNRLAPEILSLVKEAEQSGEPLIRHLEYNCPHRGYSAVNDEFMLGENILVAPVITQGARERQVVFPTGKWQDEQGNVYAGNTLQTLPAPLDTLLWFRKTE